MKFIVTEKKTPHGLLVIVTDQNILEKKFKQGKLQLDLKLPFYCGEERDEQETILLLTKARHLHLTGKEIVDLAIKEGYVNKQKVLVVQNIPHAEVIIEE